MKKIVFVCHGNICRSPMAEFIMKKLVTDEGFEEDFYIESAAVSNEETGNDMYPPAKRKLTEKGVPFAKRRARTVTREDAVGFDFIVAMDSYNLRNLERIIGRSNKVSKLLDHTSRKGEDISDPWYSGDFETAYNDIYEGCRGLLDKLK